MRTRIWNELGQAKHNNLYCIYLLIHKRELLTFFNIIVLVFSTGGIMGWKLWSELPLASCIIISVISLLKLLQPHVIPSDKQLDKLDKVADFYFDYYNKVEQLWMDVYHSRITDIEAQAKFYELKESERTIIQSITEIVRKPNRKALNKSDFETREYLRKNFNTQ